MARGWGATPGAKRMNMKKLFILSISGVSAFGLAIAQDLDDDVITVSGLRPTTIENTTQQVTILSREDLDIRSSPYLADALRAVPGVAISRSGAVGGLTQLRMRGAEANHTLILVDGIEVSDPVTGETDLGLFSLLDAQRIEVARGEQSTLYGSDAIGGVISVTTGTQQNHGRLETGSRETYLGQGALAHNGERSSFSIGASSFSTKGIDSSGQDSEEDGTRSEGIVLRGQTELSANWSLTGLARLENTYTEIDADTDFDGLLNDIDQEVESEQRFVGLSLTRQSASVDHIVRVSFHDVSREQFTDNIFTDETNGQRSKLSYSPSVSWSQGNSQHRLAALIDHEQEDYERIDTDTLFGDPNQEQSFTTTGVALEYSIDVGSFSLQGSGRYDENDGRLDDTVTGRLGVAYRLRQGGKLRASIGTGVKNPTFTELFGFFPASFVGNPDLQPEKSTSFDVGYDQFWDRGQISVTYFDATLEDEIFTAFNPDFTSTALNREGESERRGVELEGRWHVTTDLSVQGALSSTESKNDQGEDEIRVPETTGSLSLSWQSPKREGFVLAAALDWVGEQDDFDFGSFPSRRVTLDAYTLLSATSRYPLSPSVDLTLRGENLLDEEVEDVFGYAQTSRGIFVGLKVH